MQDHYYEFDLNKSKENIQALVLNEKDNVATAISDIKNNSNIIMQYPDGFKKEIQVKDDIPQYHKIALLVIPRDEQILKFGYLIARSTKEIEQGKHVHTHNVTSEKGGK